MSGSSQDDAAQLRSIGKVCIVLGVAGGVIPPSSICAIIAGNVLAFHSPTDEEMRSQAPKVRRGAIAGIAFSAIAFVVPFVAQLVVFFILFRRISSFESSTAGSALSPMAQPVVQPVVQQVAQPALQPAMQVQPAMQMMQVQVPPGVASGGAFVVATPGGGQVQVTVPAGVMAGQMMQIQVPVAPPMAQPAVVPMATQV